jgi:hypothetical protein
MLAQQPLLRVSTKEWLGHPFPCQVGSLPVPGTVSVSDAGQTQLRASCKLALQKVPHTKNPCAAHKAHAQQGKQWGMHVMVKAERKKQHLGTCLYNQAMAIPLVNTPSQCNKACKPFQQVDVRNDILPCYNGSVQSSQQHYTVSQKMVTDPDGQHTPRSWTGFCCRHTTTMQQQHIHSTPVASNKQHSHSICCCCCCV